MSHGGFVVFLEGRDYSGGRKGMTYYSRMRGCNPCSNDACLPDKHKSDRKFHVRLAALRYKWQITGLSARSPMKPCLMEENVYMQ